MLKNLPSNLPWSEGLLAPVVTYQRRAPELPRGMDETDIVEDCADRVRRQRMKLGLSQDQLAKRVKEKLSVIQKIEIGKMMPDTRLCRELEHELKIKLLIPHREISEVPKTAPPTEVTLGDIMRIKGKSDSSPLGLDLFYSFPMFRWDNTELCIGELFLQPAVFE